MSRTLRVFAVALSIVALAGPAAARAEPWKTAGWLDLLLGKLSSIWADNGCGLDPDGRCGTVLQDNGCGLDPNGLCANRQ